jgi:hypothetical protein
MESIALIPGRGVKLMRPLTPNQVRMINEHSRRKGLKVVEIGNSYCILKRYSDNTVYIERNQEGKFEIAGETTTLLKSLSIAEKLLS